MKRREEEEEHSSPGKIRRVNRPGVLRRWPVPNRSPSAVVFARAEAPLVGPLPTSSSRTPPDLP